MEIDALHSKFAGVNGTKTKSLRYRLVKRLTSQKRAEQGIFLTRLSKSIIGILSDDFATVDVREELCYHSRPKKTNSGDHTTVRVQKVRRDFFSDFAPLLIEKIPNLIQKQP